MRSFITAWFVFFSTYYIQAQTANYEYDKLQRLTKITYTNGSTVTYQYDANGNRLSHAVGITPGVAIDVTIQNASVSSSSIPRGSSIRAFGSENNIGSSPSIAHYIRFYLSADNVWDASDTQLDQILINNLASGESSVFANRSFIIPASTPIGNYFFLMVADGGNNLAEVNENNNSTAIAISVTPAITTYTFIGSGNYNVASNWLNGLMPPNPLPANSLILINGAGECNLNVPQTINTGASLRVEPGKLFRVNGNLLIQ